MFPNCSLRSKTSGAGLPQPLVSPAPAAPVPARALRRWGPAQPRRPRPLPHPPHPPPGRAPLKRLVTGPTHRRPPAPVGITDAAPPPTGAASRPPLRGCPAARVGRGGAGTAPSRGPGVRARGWAAPRGGGTGCGRSRGGKSPSPPAPPILHYLPRLRVALARHDVTAPRPARTPSPTAHQRHRTTAA